MTGKEYLRRLREEEAAAEQSRQARTETLHGRRLDRFRRDHARATSWRRTAAGFVVFGLVGVCVGVLTGVFFTEWLIRRWPDRLPLLRPRSSVVNPVPTATAAPAGEAVATAPASQTVAPASVAERRLAEVVEVSPDFGRHADGSDAGVRVSGPSRATDQPASHPTEPSRRGGRRPARTRNATDPGATKARATFPERSAAEIVASRPLPENLDRQAPVPSVPAARLEPDVTAPVPPAPTPDLGGPSVSATASVPVPATPAVAPAPVASAAVPDSPQQAPSASPGTTEVGTISAPPVQSQIPEAPRSLTAVMLRRLKQATSLTPAEAEALAKVKAVLGDLPEIRFGKAFVAWAKRAISRSPALDAHPGHPQQTD